MGAVFKIPTFDVKFTKSVSFELISLTVILSVSTVPDTVTFEDLKCSEYTFPLVQNVFDPYSSI